MNKIFTVITGLLLIGAAIIIHLLSEGSNSALDMDLVGFFSGVLVGAGFASIAQFFIKKKNAV